MPYFNLHLTFFLISLFSHLKLEWIRCKPIRCKWILRLRHEASHRTTGGVKLNQMTRLFGLELILERWRFQKPEAFGVFSLEKLFKWENSKTSGPHRMTWMKTISLQDWNSNKPWNNTTHEQMNDFTPPAMRKTGSTRLRETFQDREKLQAGLRSSRDCRNRS